jgi:hypothetical protein
MDVHCEACGTRFDEDDDEVRWVASVGAWFCAYEPDCDQRRDGRMS